MSNGNRNRNRLYHSATYLGQDYSDGIRHFKYVKREKINGKWVYYYDSKEKNGVRLASVKISGDPNSKYGVYQSGSGKNSKKITVKKGKGLFNKTYNSLATNNKVKTIGKIEQGYDKLVSQVKKGKKKLASLFKKKKGLKAKSSKVKSAATKSIVSKVIAKTANKKMPESKLVSKKKKKK